ncbi:hemogen isoform X2 [Eublepharis macularius]|uniref:Hemogen isoform X2 n=1 Tax=Eublepharis macularius TaxID=481883 RepID=A0AA97JU47_EUBMA|nr:hemogen isoform X2 [Eublepharis macularius]
MESLEKDHSYSEHPQHSETTTEEFEVREAVVVTRRLRDRELLRKRKAEAEEKDTRQWALGDQSKSKRARRGRRTGRGRGQRQAAEPEMEPQTEGVEEKHELSVAPQEEKAGTSLDPQLASSLDPQAEFSLDPQAESSAPLVETEELYTPKDVTEAIPAGPAICSAGLEQTPRSEESEMLASVENDRLEQEFYPSL